MQSKKRRRLEPPSIHPRSRYSENAPDFHLLASLYPSFKPYVFSSPRDGRARIDWTDFNATSELTRVLLLHDHSSNWWIPDGQLCPTVPNRSNYIHWIEDLLPSDVVEKIDGCGDGVRGFDIGTGANCIYPLLGASLRGWRFVGSEVFLLWILVIWMMKLGLLGFLVSYLRREYRKFLSFLHQVEGFWFRPQLNWMIVICIIVVLQLHWHPNS